MLPQVVVGMLLMAFGVRKIRLHKFDRGCRCHMLEGRIENRECVTPQHPVLGGESKSRRLMRLCRDCSTAKPDIAWGQERQIVQS